MSNLKRIILIFAYVAFVIVMVKQGKSSMKKIAEEGIKKEEITVEVDPPAPTVVQDEVIDEDVSTSDEKPTEETAVVVEEQPTSSTTTAPKKKEKPKSIGFKVDLGEEDKVSAVFEADVKKMTDERKKEVIKEMGTEIKNMLVMRQHVIDSFDDKKKGKINNSNIYKIKVLYEDANTEKVFEVEGSSTIANLRDIVGKEFKILKSHWCHWTLVKNTIDLCESSRKTVSAVLEKINWKHDDVVIFIKYD